jgi:poly(A) polymerase
MLLHEKVLERLASLGAEAYLVGGCVRDTLLKRPINDYDICTVLLPNEISRCNFAKIDFVGAHFGVCIVSEGEEKVDIATFRSDGAYSDNRRPDFVKYTRDVKEDVIRRDFTINGLLMTKDGDVIDHVGGLADLKAKVIRCIGDPNKRFQEDALRMLRAIRFSAQLNFIIEYNTQKAITDNAHLLSKISKERIRDEFNKTLLAKASNYYHFTCLGIFEHVLTRFSKSKPGWTYISHNEILGYLSHTPRNKTITYYLTILLNCTLDSNKKVEAFLIDYKYPTNTIKTILANLKALDQFGDAKKFTKAEMKRFVRQPNFDELIDLFQVFQPKLGSPLITILCNLISWQDKDLWPCPLLDGDKLIELGYKPGPKFKEMLDKIETAQLNEEISTYEEALELLNNDEHSRFKT